MDREVSIVNLTYLECQGLMVSIVIVSADGNANRSMYISSS